VAIVGTDPEYFAALAPANLTYPPEPGPPRTIALDCDEITIGRSAGAHIDLSTPIEDPAASRAHASLQRQADGTYAVVDEQSANGTCVNGDLTPITRGVPFALASGDRIHVGAWTTITIERAEGGQENLSS
jgi:predicted component of type VI protein secretion system